MFQGVTGGYKGVQWITGDYKGLQGVPRGYRKSFFLTRMSPGTFSWSNLYKTEKLNKSLILTKTMDLPFGKKKTNFTFFVNRCSNSLERLLFYPERQQTLFLDLFLINTEDEKTSTF